MSLLIFCLILFMVGFLLTRVYGPLGDILCLVGAAGIVLFGLIELLPNVHV